MGRPKKDKPNKQGLYEVKVTVGKKFDGTLIRKSFRSAKSKADARAKAEQYKINQAIYEHTGELVETKAVTFETWALKWLETYKHGSVKEHTYLFTYKINVEKYIIPYFKKAKMSDIKQIDVQSYFSTVRQENGELLAKSTLDKQKMILKSIFDSAIDNDLCYKNPVKNIKYPNGVSGTKERDVYNKEQADLLEEYAKENGRMDIVIMLNTGIRRSELIGLKWSDIDFSANTLHVQRAVVQTKGVIRIDAPKSATSNRIIPFSQKFSDYLKSQINSNDYVIGTGAPVSPSLYSKNFRDFMKKMNKDIGLKVLTPHELRHSYGTILRESGVDIYTIQKLMGHSDISVTASIYVHNDIEVLKKQMNLE